MSTTRYPPDSDLRNLVRFCADKGLIWLDENRMLLMHTAALSALRKELIDSVGIDQARRILTRMGYASGTRDAELAKKVRFGRSEQDAFVAGPQLHMLEGSVIVTPVKIEMDVPSGHFSGEFLWDNSYEAEVHVREYGQTHDSVCWMQIGYASGYTSAFMGRFILFKEVECAATGRSACLHARPAASQPEHCPAKPYGRRLRRRKTLLCSLLRGQGGSYLPGRARQSDIGPSQRNGSRSRSHLRLSEL